MIFNFNNYQRHNFHMVDPSPWPLLASFASFFITVGGVLFMHRYELGLHTLLFGVLFLLVIFFFWWRDVIRESTFLGDHTQIVIKGLKLGVILFIVSEIMFFFGFFWSFFHSSLAPTIEIGSIWPPAGIIPFDAWSIPFLNTSILLLSGASITSAHHFLIVGNYNLVKEGLMVTVVLAIFFTFLQVLEYLDAPFNISDGVYGSVFFMATGFHGFHVIIGTIFIIVSLLRYLNFQLSKNHHVGFESAAWYWHFVDVVWIFLFISIYWWGGLTLN